MVVSNTSIVNLAATKFWHERQLNWGPVHQYPGTDTDTGSFGAFRLFTIPVSDGSMEYGDTVS